MIIWKKYISRIYKHMPPVASKSKMTLKIFLIYFYITMYYMRVYHIFIYDLSTLVGCWSSVYIRRIIYKFLNVCHFDYTGFAVSGKGGYPLTANHTSWMTVVTPTDRPKLVHNRCVIEVLCCPLVFEFSVGIGVFVIGLSQISFFFSWPWTTDMPSNSDHKHTDGNQCTPSLKCMGRIALHVKVAQVVRDFNIPTDILTTKYV